MYNFIWRLNIEVIEKTEIFYTRKCRGQYLFIDNGATKMVVRQDRKEQILAKAAVVFAEIGYYKATTTRVAKEAGV